MPKETDLIKQKLNIVDFIRGYLPLMPAGKNFKALCPFHPEKTPSFIVSPDRQTWHCFGCSEGGDIIKFVMKYENLEFPEALRFLGEKAGVPIQVLNPREQREFGVLYDLHEAARDYYRAALGKHERARKYLADRGLRPETLEAFGVGYAPGGESLTLHLIQKGFDVADVVRGGLAGKAASGMFRDRFQARITFPIANQLGKIVAFTGRILEVPVGMKEGDLPKYLNSPETPIFSKSKVLYGLDRTKNAIARSRTALLVEGQMDLLMAWQSGVENIVATSGTALTTQHLERLRRIADTVIVSFDNDPAGLKALERSLDTMGGFDFHVKAIRISPYKDPADAVKADPEFLKRAVAAAEPAFRYLFAETFALPAVVDDTAERKRAVREFLGKIRRLPSAVEQDVWLKDLANYSGVSETALATELANLPAPKTGTAEPAAEAKVILPGAERIDLIARRLLTLAFFRDEFLEAVRVKRDLLPAFYAAALDDPSSQARQMLELQASYTLPSDDPLALREELDELLEQLELEKLVRDQLALRVEIRAAERRGDEPGTLTLMERFNKLSHAIDELRGNLYST